MLALLVRIIAFIICTSWTQVSAINYVSRIWNRGYVLQGVQVYDAYIPEEQVDETDVLVYNSPQNIRYMEVVNSTLHVLPPNAFKRDNYWGLYLSNVHIDKILPGAFEGMTRLEELDLSYNNIYQIDYGVFNNFEELMFVNLSHNNIKTINENAFRGTIFLKELRIQNNKIVALSNNLFHSQKSLSLLNISFNYLEVVEETFTGLSNLTELHLQYNKISKMSPNTFKGLTSLIYLDISHNNLSHFVYGLFTSLEGLNYLNFSYNSMSKFPFMHLFHLTNLTELRFRNHKIPFDEDILLYFPKLKNIDSDGLNSLCWDILNITVMLRHRNITLLGDKNYTVENIEGIPCYMGNKYNTTEKSNITDTNFQRESVTENYKNIVLSQNKTLINIKNAVEENSDLLKENNILLEKNIRGSTQHFIFTVAIITILVSISVIVIGVLFYLLKKLTRAKEYKCQETLITQTNF